MSVTARAYRVASRKTKVCGGLGALMMVLAPITGLCAPLSPGPSAFPQFPGSGGVTGIRRWLAARTDLPRHGASFLTAMSAFSLLDPKMASGPRLIRQEVFNAKLARALQGRSIILAVSFDCSQAAAAVQTVQVYPGNNLKGGAPRSMPPREWLAANADADLSDFALVVCEAHPGSGEETKALTAPSSPAPHSPVSPKVPTPTSGASVNALWAQIGAFDTVQLAERRWSDLRARLPAETEAVSLRTERTKHKVIGLQRALVGPFLADLDAKAFCAKASSSGFECFIRTLSSRP